MASGAIDGHSYAGSCGGNLRCHANFLVERFDLTPIDFHADQMARWATVFCFRLERRSANKAFFLQIHQLAETDLAGSVLLLRDDGAFAGNVVDLDQDQSGFDPRDVESYHSGRMDVELATFGHQFVENPEAIIPWHPNFVTQVTGVTGARNINGHAGDFAVSHAEIFQAGNVGIGDGVQQFATGRPLQGERRDLLGDVFDVYVKPEGILLEPAETGIGGGPAIVIFAEPGDGAVVNDFAFLIAPAAIDDLSDRNLVDVATDDAIDEAGGVRPGDAVLEKGRDVDERGRIADSVVLVLVRHFVDTDGVVARPFFEIQAVAESEGSFVESGSDGHKSSGEQQTDKNRAEENRTTANYSFVSRTAAREARAGNIPKGGWVSL